MENKGLIFIPDISGFTRFVNETEIEHSRLIIQELLEILINANESGLEVSEIEGDAILFYKFGEPPTLESLYKQVEKMFCAFHRGLISYEHNRYCQCRSCKAAIDLTLKVITHYGEFTGYNVRKFSKLIGRDIIVAHQLLKNDIDLHEYWLITSPLAGENKPPAFLTEWMQWNSSVKQTEAGEIHFLYTQLGDLKHQLTREPLSQPDLSTKAKVISVSQVYESGIIPLFHATGDFNYRSMWQEGVKNVEEIAHLLPRIGMRCRRIMENGDTIIYSSSYTYQSGKIEFSETDEKSEEITYYILEEINNGRTKLTIDFYISKNMLTKTVFKILKKQRAEAVWNKSLDNLQKVIKTIKV
ncbi:MAG: DUF2652 domain-containing protein [Ferruginibacter sp.]